MRAARGGFGYADRPPGQPSRQAGWKGRRPEHTHAFARARVRSEQRLPALTGGELQITGLSATHWRAEHGRGGHPLQLYRQSGEGGLALLT